jgi:hypothetical protein
VTLAHIELSISEADVRRTRHFRMKSAGVTRVVNRKRCLKAKINGRASNSTFSETSSTMQSFGRMSFST